jgi:polyisoprenoid-binding protein YceI
MQKVRYVESLVIACAGLTLASGAFAAEWKMLDESSAVTFTGTQQGSRFTGRFSSFDADIAFDPANPADGKIVGIVETATVNTRDHDRDSALLDRDWFDVENHPEARFESQSIEEGENGAYRARGQLTLKGETKPAVLDFTFDIDKASPAMAHFSGTMSLNRFDYKVGEGWNDTSWIGERVTVDIELDLAQ